MQENPQNSDRQYYLFALKIMGDFGVVIAVPVIVFVLAGQWLDDKYGRSPLFTVFGFLIAVLISIKILYKKAKVYGEEYARLGNNSKSDKK